MTQEFRDKKSLYMIGLVLFSFLAMTILTRNNKILPITFGALFIIFLIIFLIVNYKQKHPEVILKSKKEKQQKHSKKIIYKESLNKNTKQVHHSDLVNHMRK